MTNGKGRPLSKVEEIKEVEEEEDEDKDMPFDLNSKKVKFRDQSGKGLEISQTFYFPKQKILFVGDLVIFPKEKVMDQKERALSVYNLIVSEKLEVDKIYTSWPLKDQKEFGSIIDLKNSLLKFYPDLK